MGIVRRQEQKLGHHDVRHVVVDGHAQEDDAVHHQAAEHVHRGHVQFALFNDGGVDVTVAQAGIPLQGKGGDASFRACILFKFVLHADLFEFAEFFHGDFLVGERNHLTDSGDDLLVLHVLLDLAALV